MLKTLAKPAMLFALSGLALGWIQQKRGSVAMLVETQRYLLIALAVLQRVVYQVGQHPTQARFVPHAINLFAGRLDLDEAA